MKNRDIFVPEKWIRALHLEERLQCIEDWDYYPPDATRLYQIDKWKARFLPNSHIIDFKQRLHSLKLDEAQLEKIVCECPKYDVSRLDFDWLKILKDAFECWRGKAQTCPIPQSFLINPAQMVIDHYRALLHQKIESIVSNAFDTAHGVDVMMPLLMSRLHQIMAKSVVMELHVKKHAHDLKGDTPEARYQYYIDQYDNPEHCMAFFMEYPVLTRHIITVANHWLRFSHTFLQQLHNDYDEINQHFFGEDTVGPLKCLVSSTADTHREGRIVLIAEFHSGQRIVYKPRALRVDACFNELLRWFNKRSTFNFRCLSVLVREEHSWISYVDTHEKIEHNNASKQGFFYRQGGILAILYWLHATDFHFENVMACGDQYLPIDLEGLFHSYFTYQAGKDALDQYSVMTTGLLPALHNNTPHYKDDSGIFGIGGQRSGKKVIRWQKPYTDEMTACETYSYNTMQGNLLFADGKAINPLHYFLSICRGFKHISQLIIRYRQELLQENGPLDAFRPCETRFINRSTYVYAALQFELYQPMRLRDALQVDRFLDLLWNVDMYSVKSTDVVASEIADMRQGDIPYFSTAPDKLDIKTSHERLIHSVFNKSAFSAVVENIEQMDENAIKKQLKIIHRSFVAMSQNANIQALYQSQTRSEII